MKNNSTNQPTPRRRKFGYVTETDKKGNVYRYRTYFDNFKDEDTGEFVPIKRHHLIKVNGKRVRFYSNTEIKRMSPAERKKIFTF
jgi:hypothetical protein